MTKLITLVAAALFLLTGNAHAFGKRPINDALDTQVQSLYPGNNCAELAAFARQREARTLVIGFEGLASFDSSGTHVSYRQHLEALRGETIEPMRKGSGGYLLHGLLNRVMKERARSVEVIMFPQTATGSSAGSVPELCAETWMREPGNKLVVLGHSFGGHAANQLTENLARRNIPVAAVISVDPRLKGYIGSFQRSPNVALWENYFQKNTPFLNGYVVAGAQVNANLSSTGVKHVTIPFSPVLKAALDRVLDSLR